MSAFSFGRSDLLRAVNGVMEAGARSAVAFVGQKKRMPLGRVKVTRRGLRNRRSRAQDFLLTVGRLSYGERLWCARQLRKHGSVPRLRLQP